MANLVLSSESVVRYAGPAGARWGEADLTDASYDGLVAGGAMSAGLGQLVDRLYGLDDFDSLAHRGPTGAYTHIHPN